MKLLFIYNYYSTKNPEIVDVLCRKWPEKATIGKGVIDGFNMTVIRDSQEHQEIAEILTSLGVSTKPHETRGGGYEKKDFDRAKYFLGGPKRYVQPGTFSQIVDGKVILNKPLPKFRYGIAVKGNIISNEVRQALETELFTGVSFLPVYLSKKDFEPADRLINPEVELIPGIHRMVGSIKLPYASTPDPLYNDVDEPIVPQAYSLRDFEALGLPDVILAPVRYKWTNHIRRDDEGKFWTLYSKRFCDFLTKKFKEFAWEPFILAEDTL